MKKVLVLSVLVVFLAFTNVYAVSFTGPGWTDITTYDQMGSNTLFGTADTRTSPIDYTIQQQNGGDNSLLTVTKSTQIREDNETERGTAVGQAWDLEAVYFNTLTNQVALIGGYNFLAGYGGWDPGDIFISTDNVMDLPAEREPTAFTEPPGYNDYRGFEVALNIDFANATATGASYDVLKPVGAAAPNWLTTNAYYNQVGDPDAGASPWRVYEGTSPTPNYTVDSGKSLIMTTDVQNTGLNGYGANSTHYALLFNLDDVFPEDVEFDSLFIKYTMECGNDSLLGVIEGFGGTPPPVPEPTTLLLLGTGLIGLAGAGRKKFIKKS
jgi:hypothetical protein